MVKHCAIVLTAFGMLVGSLGIPISTYSCEMRKVKWSLTPPCGACSCTTERARPASDAHRRSGLERAPCCSTLRTILHIDTPATSHPSPLLVRLAVPFVDHALRLTAQPTRSDARARFSIEHPPPLAHRSQAAYLFNATFRI